MAIKFRARDMPLLIFLDMAAAAEDAAELAVRVCLVDVVVVGIRVAAAAAAADGVTPSACSTSCAANPSSCFMILRCSSTSPMSPRNSVL